MATQPADAPLLTTLSLSRRMPASAQRVYDAWLDARNAGKWLFATPTGMMVRVEIDPRVGGAFTITERRPDGEVAHTGEYLELERPHRIAFTFGVLQFSSIMTRVILDITPLDGQCDITLTHEGVLSEYAARTREGWGKILDGLAKTLQP